MLVAMAFVDVGSAFLPMRRTTCQLQHQRRLLIVDDIQKSRLADSAAKSDEAAAVTEDASNKEDIRSMRLSEIQKELQRLNVSSKDCFDRDSLTHRLLEARQQLQQQQQQSLPVEDSQLEQSTTTESSKTTTTSTDETRTAPTATSTTTATDKTYTKQQLDQEVAALSVRELRAELGAAGKRWAGMLEKRDLVDAVVNLRQQAANFSVTGRMQPGQVTDLTAEELELELQSTSTLVLLDVYATW
jgi:E3 ubiquitin-protein ligase DOA10